MFILATFALLLSIILVLLRLYFSQTLFDRVLAVNAFGTVAVVLIGVVGFLSNRPDFLDIALLYALINFLGTVAVKYFKYGTIGDTDEQSSNFSDEWNGNFIINHSNFFLGIDSNRLCFMIINLLVCSDLQIFGQSCMLLQ